MTSVASPNAQSWRAQEEGCRGVDCCSAPNRDARYMAGGVVQVHRLRERSMVAWMAWPVELDHFPISSIPFCSSSFLILFFYMRLKGLNPEKPLV